MNLEALYDRVSERLSALDFRQIWPGFAPLKFALYDAERCFFDGRYIEKTADFCANTSIVYQGEQIAIWMVQEEPEASVLASKLVHEMFHGFQRLQGWDCWPDEMEALFHWEYSAENLSLKLRENELLLRLLNGFDEAALRELLGHRKLRSGKYPYECAYESKVEEIEGSANYVEWQALKQLDAEKAAELTGRMRDVMTKAERLFPIRVSCYFSGALLIHALRSAGLYSFEAASRPVLGTVLEPIEASDGSFPGREALERTLSASVAAFRAESAAIVEDALARNEIVLRGPAELVGLNVYNARRYRDYLTSTYFLMYRDEAGDHMIQGDFVIRMQDEKTISAVYRWGSR